ncbi:unnamed protein product [Urochloa humidicola]
MGVPRRSERRQGATAAEDTVDLISGLDDDVLLRVLELLRDARDAARTGAVSRRWRGLWRGLWTRVPTLRFGFYSTMRTIQSSSSHGAGGARRFLSFVSNALTRRAQAVDDAAAALERLVISFVLYVERQTARELRQQCIEASQGWIWNAMEIGVKSFVLHLSVPSRACRRRVSGDGDDRRDGEQQQQQLMMNLSDLPSNAKLETMHLYLDGEMIQPPVTAVFTLLTDLSLQSIEFPNGSGHLLSRLLSSACCPRLQKLKLRNLRLSPQSNELLVESGTLLELSCEEMLAHGVALELRTPILRVLCMRRQRDYDCIRTFRICSPKLEELTLEDEPTHIHVVDSELSCVRMLQIQLFSHTENSGDYKNASICILQCCTSSVTCLGVSLTVIKVKDRVADIIRGRIPHLPHLIYFNVHVDLLELHSFGVGIADILAQCSNLKYLCVDCSNCMAKPGYFHCDHLDHWKSHEMYLPDIREVEFNKLVGTDCEAWFMQHMLRHAKQLQKLTLRFDPWYELDKMRSAFEFIPGGSGGKWTRLEDTYLSAYEWKRDL